MDPKESTVGLDLVPDFDEPESGPSPVEILRGQAALIEKKAVGTRAVVELARSGSDRVAYDLVLEVPIVGYRYKVLRIESGIDGWPVDVTTPGAPVPRRAHDLEGYSAILRDIFSTPGFRTAVASLRRIHEEELVVSPVEREVLNVFRSFSLAPDEELPASTLMSAIGKLDEPIRAHAQQSVDKLLRRGMLIEMSGGLGFALTEKGAGVVYRT